MNWTEKSNPKEGVSYYTHTICETPLGRFLIEWKDWKEDDSYSVTIGNEYIGQRYDLNEAKELAKSFLINKRDELSLFLSK